VPVGFGKCYHFQPCRGHFTFCCQALYPLFIQRTPVTLGFSTGKVEIIAFPIFFVRLAIDPPEA
jgi:hypothetical protein